MTTANLLNVSSVKAVKVDVSKKLQEEAREVTEIFAAMMNQSVDVVSQRVDDTSSEIGIRGAEGTQEITNSYESFGYKDNKIEVAKEKDDLSSDFETVEEQLQQTEEEILGTLSEEYGVDEEVIHNLLEEMGLSVLDLLNPQNLVSFVMALTGISTGEELLLDESFLKVMETLETLSNELMKEFSVDQNGLQEIISMMESVSLEGEEVSFEQVLDVQSESLESTEAVVQETVAKPEEMQNEMVQNVSDEEVENVVKAVENTDESIAENTKGAENVKDTEDTEEVEEGVKVLAEESTETSETIESTEGKDAKNSLFDNQNRGKDFTWNQDAGSNQVFISNQPTTVGQFSEMPQMQLNSYLSVDTLQVMEQIAEQIKVVVTPDTTSMEMQLNPENLGKIYLHISAEEGVVNAQFTATTEVVKEALEAQMAVLRENLTQAGVKVDAIEVTVASHEFEKNLEQDQKQSEEQLQETKTAKRRNLTADSLEELQGVMTEEETLVAQIMKDNGNSVDFTA